MGFVGHRQVRRLVVSRRCYHRRMSRLEVRHYMLGRQDSRLVEFQGSRKRLGFAHRRTAILG